MDYVYSVNTGLLITNIYYCWKAFLGRWLSVFKIFESNFSGLIMNGRDYFIF